MRLWLQISIAALGFLMSAALAQPQPNNPGSPGPDANQNPTPQKNGDSGWDQNSPPQKNGDSDWGNDSTPPKNGDSGWDQKPDTDQQANP